MTSFRLIVGSLLLATTVLAPAQAGAQELPADSTQGQPRAAKPVTPPSVIFLCPHGAAKSVLASAYFQRRARERGLKVQVDSAGTEPDQEVSPAVAAHLATSQNPVPIAKPRQVTARDLETADVVVSMGCDLKNWPAPRGTLVTWDDVPSPSEDLARADAAIHTRVVALVEELIRQRDTR